jgi:WD40 repeat protein
MDDAMCGVFCAIGWQVWDTASQQCVRTLRGHDGWVSSLAVLQTGDLSAGPESSSRVLSASYDTTLKVWSPATGDLLASVSAGTPNDFPHIYMQ